MKKQPGAVCGAKQPPSDQGESPEIGTKVGAGSESRHNVGIAPYPHRPAVMAKTGFKGYP